MSTIRNSVQLIGNVGREPQTISFESGKKLSRLSLATNESYHDKNGEKVEQAQWHNLVAWGNTAGIIEKYVSKGKEIAVEGKLTYRSFQGKDGNTQTISEIVVSEILLLGSNNPIQQ